MNMLSENIPCPPELQRFARYRPQEPGATADNLRHLEQLLYKIWAKKIGKTKADQQVLLQFQAFCRLDDSIGLQQEQRILQLLNKSQPLLIGLDTRIDYQPQGANTLCLVFANPTPQLIREIRVRFSCPDGLFADTHQPQVVKLLDSQCRFTLSLDYRAPAERLHTEMALQVEICDHQGEWRAYKSRGKLFLGFPGIGIAERVSLRQTATPTDKLNFHHYALGYQPPNCSGNHPHRFEQPLSGLDQLLSIQLEPDEARVSPVQTAPTDMTTSRGTPLTRAVLRSQNVGATVERIELVSKPFMVCGRYNDSNRTGFGDFALGFVPQYKRISRLHCAIGAQPDGSLAIIHVGSHEQSHTAINARKLPRGQWQNLALSDSIGICGLYDLEIALAWDITQGSFADADPRGYKKRCGALLLESVDLVKKLEKTPDPALKQLLKETYIELNRLQKQGAADSGADKPGTLLHARFQRTDAGANKVTHIYLPKRITLGSAASAGLQIEADGVLPHHAELLYQDGMYWIQNNADTGAVQVCQHRLASQEMVALEAGDSIALGAAQFVFERF